MKRQRQSANHEEAKDFVEQMVDDVYSRMAQGEKPSFAFLLERLLNEFMVRERDRHLRFNPEEKANGFYPRSLHLTLGKLNLHVPRVRNGKGFRPAILPPRWKRADKDYEELLIGMLANGYSHAQMARSLKTLRLPLSEEALQDAKALICEQLSFYKSQPLPGDLFAVFIDAYWGKLRGSDGKIHEISLFVAVGIDFDGNKQVLGFWVLKGRESKGFWVEVLQDLVNRGVHRVLLFVTDDFPGLSEVIRKLFPYADHQLCLIHLQRNLKKKLSSQTYKQAKDLLAAIRRAHDKDEAKPLFTALCELVGREQPKTAELMRTKADSYLAFLNYPDQARGHIYTTNIVESVNAGIEKMRLDLGGYFPSQECLDVNLFIQVANLQDRWWRKPVPTIRAVSYELRQLFALKYELEPQTEVIHNF